MNQEFQIEIEEPQKPYDYEAIEEIQIDAWKMSERDVVPSRLAIAIHEAGGCIYIAYINGEAVGYVLGFLAGEKNKIYLHSHQVGVKRKYWGRGIGYLLKLKQREWALEKGLDLIRWTFDPLLARNAHFNFNKLGVINNTYKINLYGEMRDEINRGLETDRFYVEWWLKSNRVRDRLKGIRPKLRLDSNEIPIAISITREKGMVVPSHTELELKDKLIAIPIPTDIETIKTRDIEIAIKWRKATREVFKEYFSKGYIAAEFITQKDKDLSYYILVREKKDKVLKSKWWE